MDFYAECEKQKQERFAAIGTLAYQRQQAAVQIKQLEADIEAMDRLIVGHEQAINELERAQRNFNTYLAVKEGALTTDQLADSIRAGGNGAEPQVEPADLEQGEDDKVRIRHRGKPGAFGVHPCSGDEAPAERSTDGAREPVEEETTKSCLN